MSDEFSYFIVFYSLILGLALAELLGGFALMVRSHLLSKLEKQTALVAVLILVCIVTEWVDVWNSLKCVTIDLAGLGAPILLAIFYYLAAAVVFPHDNADYERLGDYYQQRRQFIFTMLLAAEVFGNFIYRHIYFEGFKERPAVFWLWFVPYNLAIVGAMVALLIVNSRRANVVLLTALILLLTVPYWSNGAFRNAIARHYGYKSATTDDLRCGRRPIDEISVIVG